MEHSLTDNQRNYILFHLGLTFELTEAIRSKFNFGRPREGRINFYEASFSVDAETAALIERTPVLLPGRAQDPPYTLSGGTLTFHHDYLGSAFYLLSGYQEWRSKAKDSLGRFPYEVSIQKKLGIMHRALVNEYFSILADGIKKYCEFHHILFTKREFFEEFGFFLTHDVDRIDKYTVQTVKGKFKKGKIFEGVAYLLRWLNPLYRENPKWTYDYLSQVEKHFGLSSAYFFLNRDKKHIDSYYRFSDQRIRQLIGRLEKKGKEIGLHGSSRTARRPDLISLQLRELQAVTAKTVIGNRQHRLNFKMPETFRHLQTNGIKYDTSLGFAAYEGFRNSFCLPFRPYDHDNDCMMGIWEIPLNVMDGTLFSYRGLNNKEAVRAVENVINEVKKYHGLFTLLVHPDFLDEENRPGIRAFYEGILKIICQKGGVSLNGKQIMERLNAE